MDLPEDFSTTHGRLLQLAKLLQKCLPDFSTTPTDFKLLNEHLRPYRQRYMSERMNLQGGVNRRLPRMDPWKLPGMPPDKEAGKKREKYFLADYPDGSSPSTPHGFWRLRNLGYGIRDESNPSSLAGTKRTYDFHKGDPSRGGGGTKTNWVMDVYLLLGQDRFIQDELVLCHVFENNSPDYDPRPKCAASHQPPNDKGKPCNQAIHGPSSSSSLSTHPVSDQTLHPELTSYQELCSSSSLSTHTVSDQTLHPEVTSYIEELENLLLGEADTSTDTGSYDARGGGPCSAVIASGENGQSRKHTRTSSVWERFTKIFEHGPDGVVVTLAVCNNCCKVLTGDSKNGTSHLARHKCQSNHGSKFSGGECYREGPSPPFDPPTPLVPSPMNGGCGGTRRGPLPLPPPPRALVDGQRMRGPSPCPP